MPFHPLDMGDAALRRVLGADFEDDSDPSLADPTTVELLAFEQA